MRSRARDSAQSAPERAAEGGTDAARRTTARVRLHRGAVHAIEVVVTGNAEAVRADNEVSVTLLEDDLPVSVIGRLRLKKKRGERLADVQREDRAEGGDRERRVDEIKDDHPWDRGGEA